ncbi:hypothetical protein TRFO_07969 [Tritrichomonas foetus]|uniref:E3 ubiquitin-protein ligase CHFR n=1 Tax=Tritrichomonas foetus TaxID=1144522 RepID=A0A1J4JNL7_9EUKA|nr:hypothetical protein TRFO_07969 [Tritrichomonas foetus]|eukprot:OHT00306.1 hypothetical protein TRFO_07969 [Tritrichomonas foetus]
MSFSLLIYNSEVINPNTPKIIVLDKDSTNIGRDSEVKMDAIKEKTISKLHATIERRATNDNAYLWTLTDYTSVNGTLVNGRQVSCTKLRSFDNIIFGGGANLFFDNLKDPRYSCRYIFLTPTISIKLFRNINYGDYTNEKECLICYDEFEKKKKANVLPCGHRFCGYCIRKWEFECLSEFKLFTCPVCRKSINKNLITTNTYHITNNCITIYTIKDVALELNSKFGINDLSNYSLKSSMNDYQKIVINRLIKLLGNANIQTILTLFYYFNIDLESIYNSSLEELTNIVLNLNGNVENIDNSTNGLRDEALRLIAINFYLKIKGRHRLIGLFE